MKVSNRNIPLLAIINYFCKDLMRADLDQGRFMSDTNNQIFLSFVAIWSQDVWKVLYSQKSPGDQTGFKEFFRHLINRIGSQVWRHKEYDVS